jgi:glutamate transport system permease protein
LERGEVSQTSVLFDVAGPRTRARHRIYTVVSLVVILGLAALLVLRMADRGQFAYDLWEPFLTPEYVQALLVDGLFETLKMAFFSVILAVVFGTIFGVGKLSDHASVRWVCWSVVEFFRAVPVLMLMIFFFVAYGAGPGGLDPFWCVVIALTLYNGSVLAEVFRAGILAVPRGQSEAAYAIGMRKSQVMNIILLPQAVKIMLPAIISQCVVALKDTSLGYAIVAPGLTFVGKSIYGEFQNQLQTVIVIAAMYVSVNLVLTWIATWVQRKFVGEKKILEVSMTAEADAGTGLAPGTR